MVSGVRGIVLAALAATTLSACASEDAPVAATAASGIPGLTLKDGALYLPAVARRPGVAYFTLANSGDRPLAVRTFEITGAGRSEMHGSMEMAGEMTMSEIGPQLVPAKGETRFEAGGLHVMAFDLADTVRAGTTTRVTVTVAGGDSASFDLPVRAAGDAR